MTIASLLKALSSVWPFIRELLFGGKSSKEILQEYKLTALIVIILFFSMLVNVLMITRYYEIVMERRNVAPPSVGQIKPPPDPKPTPMDEFDEILRHLDEIYKQHGQ